MERTRTLIVGAGVSGLAAAARLGDDDYWLIEAEPEIGGYCRTVKRDGFVWDYSGHFFHFRHPEIEAELVSAMSGRVLRVERESRIWYADRLIDFPFQYNIDQLPPNELEECRRDLEAAVPDRTPANFEEMLYDRFGKAIADKFLVPYNEKVYATDLAKLDVDAMGRFFPNVSREDILERRGGDRGYNVTFTYPEGGAVQYVTALATAVRSDRIRVNERLLDVDLDRRVAKTSNRAIGFERLIGTLPFPSLLRTCRVRHDVDAFDWNQVLVFNLGFDRKGPRGIHWIYFPQRDLCFYRVGFYDNIFAAGRMSLYVEIGLPKETELGPDATTEWLPRVLSDLRKCGVVTDQSLMASHHVLLDPAYVHITKASTAEVARAKGLLAEHGVYATGRYGSWQYCSIEDNIVEARRLVDSFES